MMARRCVVTGSASGIGAATTLMFRQAGCDVLDIDLHDAEVCADLGTAAGRARAVNAVLERFGGVLDAFVAVAGVAASSELAVRVNYFGAVELVEMLQPALVRGDAPRVVVVSSFASLRAVHGNPVVDACLAGDEASACAAVRAGLGEAYASSKAALNSWVRKAATSVPWTTYGVAFNAVAPGIVATPMTAAQLSDPLRRAALVERVPMPLRGPAQPVDVAAVLCWLSSDRNTLITGQVLFVDGGAEVNLREASDW